MLQSIRSRASSWVIKILFLVLILAFGVWGIEDIFRGPGQQATVATVGNASISVAELNSEFRRQLDRLRPMFGGQLDSDKGRQLGLLDRSLDMLVGEALLQQEIKRLGIAVPDDAIRQRIAALPQLKNEAGLFDPRRFEMLLRNSGRSEGEFIAGLRQELTRDQLAGTIAAGIRTPATLADTVFRFRSEKRVADYVAVDAARMPEPPAPDEAAQKAYLEQHKDRFSTPEYRAFEFVRIDPAKMVADFKVPDDQLKAAYDQRLSEFQHPAKRDVLQMALPDEATAKRAVDELAQGKDFLAVAKEVANQGEDVVKLGAVSRGDIAKLLPELAAPTFELAVGQSTQPIKSLLGWHVVKVLSEEPARTESFEEAKPRLLAELAREAAPDAITRLANRFEDERAGSGQMDDAAQRAGLVAVKVPAMDREGRAPDGKPIDGLPQGGVVERAVFESAVNTDGPMLETPDGGIVFFRVTGISPPAVKPFEQVREQVVQAIVAEKRLEAAKAEAEAIQAKVKGGATLAAAAGEGVEVKTTQPFTRDDRAAFGRPAASLVADLFKASAGDTAIAQSGPGYIVAQLKSIAPADPAADAPALAQVADALRQQIGADVYAQFNNALRSRFGVEVKQSVVDGMFKN
ncbi:MAG: SurA N-terminal domain-containing protein [Rhodospirillales bacterium]|nr:SurA N-terminal domain-containing protein [Rhodospirillales bacterium]